METNNIVVRDLCKQFDGFLLDHVSFQVPKGRIVGFIGENGAGKSTTIHLILDELKRDSGQIQIFGKENTFSAVREDIGVVFDECNFHDVFHTSDIEKIMSGIYKSWDSSLYRQYLKQFNIPEGKQIGSFSKGMKMKLSIICAMAHRPRLLIRLPHTMMALLSLSMESPKASPASLSSGILSSRYSGRKLWGAIALQPNVPDTRRA